MDSALRNMEIMVERMRKPWLSSNWFFSLTPLGREQKALLKITNGFTDNVSHTSTVIIIQKLHPSFAQVISQRRQYLKQLEQTSETLPYTEGTRYQIIHTNISVCLCQV